MIVASLSGRSELAHNSVLARIAGRSWREALLRAYYFFRLWRNECVLRLSSRTAKRHTRDAGKPMVDNGNDAVRIDGSSVPPEAEKIIGTKQSFAPARYYHLATLITYVVSDYPFFTRKT
jgi:hypothetical protein